MSDCRTLLLAGAAWVGSFSVWWSPGWAAPVVGAALLAGAAALHRRAWTVTAAALACCAGSLTALIAWTGSAPASQAADGYLWLEADTTSATRQLRSDNPWPQAAPGSAAQSTSGAGSRVVLSATLVAYGTDREGWTGSVPVRILGSARHWEEIGIGSRVALRGRLRPPENGEAASVVTAVGAVRVLVPPNGVQAPAAAMREALAAALADADDEAGSLVAGLAIGDETRQSPQFAEQMQTAGLSHLTAVSGGNVVIVLGMVLVPLRMLRVGVGIQTAAAAAALAGYVVLVGPQPSVLRAAAMGAAGMVGILLGGAPRGLPVLGTCCLVLLLGAPALSVSLGFALSAAATAALVAGAPHLVRTTHGHRVFGRIPEPVLLLTSVTVSAQLATAPLLLAVGAPVSWVALPANLLAAPLVPLITVLGLAASAAGPWAPPLGRAAADLALIPAGLLVRIAEAAAQHSGAGQGLVPVALVATVGIAVAVVLRAGRHRRIPVVAAAAVLIAVVFISLPIQRGSIVADWRVVVCDVGQGTAVLLRDGPAAAVLVDTGPAGGAAVACLADAGVSEVTALLLTHLHADHIGGIDEVLRTVPVRQVVTSGSTLPAPGWAQVARAAHDHGVTIRRTAAGDTIDLAQARLSLMWPPVGGLVGAGDEDVNNNSLVVRASWTDGFSVLTTGDIETQAQSRLLREAVQLASDVVVVPHHGSDYQDPGFAAAAHAAVAVVSAGAGNSYGHPAPTTLAEYRGAGSEAWRTDVAGTIAVAPQGAGLLVSGYG